MMPWQAAWRWPCRLVSAAAGAVGPVPAAVRQRGRAAPSGAWRFVVGIGAYQNAPKLANPVNDARAIGESPSPAELRGRRKLYDADFRHLSHWHAGVRHQGAASRCGGDLLRRPRGSGGTRELPAASRCAARTRARPGLRGAVAGSASSARSRRRGSSASSCWTPVATIPFVERLSRSINVASRGPATAGPGARGQRAAQHPGGDGDQSRPDRRGRRRQSQPLRRGAAEESADPGAGAQPVLPQRARQRAAGDEQHAGAVHLQLARRGSVLLQSAPAEPAAAARPPSRRWRCATTPGPTPLPIPQPTDPDQDPLTVRITGLPRSGEVRIEGRLVTPGAVYTVDRFATATYKPTGSTLGRCRHARHPGGGRPRRQRPGQSADQRHRLQPAARGRGRIAACGSIPVRSASRRPPTRTAIGCR